MLKNAEKFKSMLKSERKYLLSIIIPTRNRNEYCFSAVKQILSLPGDFQVVVQDNSDLNSLKKKLEDLKDNRIKYNYHPGELSFVDNFSEATVIAEGEYLCVIGDDDGVLSNIIDIARFAKEKNYDAIVPGLNSVFFWPSKKPIIKHAENGYLYVGYVKNTFKDVDCRKALIKLMKNSGQGYQSLKLPRLYHGIVHYNAMNKVFDKTGKLFDGLSPDIYNAVSLSLVCKKVGSLGFPVTVSGICSKSGSADSATGKHTGKLSEAPHFRGHLEYEWKDNVPNIYSVETIWADSALCALTNFGEEELSSFFNVNYLYGLCLCKYRSLEKEISSGLKSLNIMKLKVKNCYRVKAFLGALKKVLKRLFRKRNEVYKIYGLEDICAAVNKTEEIMNLK